MREKKAEEQEITLLQSNATVNQPNTSIINKLKQEMLKLQEIKARLSIHFLSSVILIMVLIVLGFDGHQ